VAVAAQAPGQPCAVVLVHQVLERPVQRVPEVAAEPAGVRGHLRDHAVDDAVGGQVGGTDALAGGQFRGVAGVAVDDGAGAFRCQRGQPGVLGGQDAVSGQQGQCRAAGSLPEQERDGGDREGGEVGQAAGDLAGQAVLLGPGRQLGAGRVDHRDQRQP
jgi:hypothetical protein